MSILVELTRSCHEEIERFERLIVKDLQQKPTSKLGRFNQNHRVRNLIDSITSTTQQLINIYEDRDINAIVMDEIPVGGDEQKDEIVLSAFRNKLKEITDYHRCFPTEHDVCFNIDASEDAEALLKEEPYVEFSGEEGYGRYLDMHDLYNEYINFVSPKRKRIEYLEYLDIFSQLPNQVSCNRRYRQYLEHLLNYLVHFYQRIEPLQDLNRIFSKVEAEFEEVKGKVYESVIDLDSYNTVEDLMAVGSDKLKLALAALGLKTGGTIKQQAERLFLTKHIPLEQLDIKYFVLSPRDMKHITLMEIKVGGICVLLKQTIEQTKEYIETKHGLSYKEIEAEHKYLEENISEDENGSSSKKRQKMHNNPLNFPLGGDGKPIPHWLYKLQGLNQKFKCQICGNHSYQGRRNFELHFKKGCHQRGLRCLGIQNSNKFNEITSIEEAKQLWEKIIQRQDAKKWKSEHEEEFEDKDGNIYTKKSYDELQRQGLV